jgi:hypothetical protein
VLIPIAVAGCIPKQTARDARDARDAWCHDAAIVALDESCRSAVEAVSVRDRGAVLAACVTLTDIQAESCGDAR